MAPPWLFVREWHRHRATMPTPEMDALAAAMKPLVAERLQGLLGRRLLWQAFYGPHQGGCMNAISADSCSCEVPPALWTAWSDEEGTDAE